MRIRFGEISTSELQKGAKLFDHKTNKDVTLTDTSRETPSSTDHSGLFEMFVKLDGNSKFEAVKIGEGEKVARFSKIG